MRLITDDERRARLAVPHAITPTARVDDAVAATRAVTVLHATEAPSVYLSLFARVDGLEVADVDRALYDDRSLVKQLAMRRTIFVFPRDLLPAAWGSAGARVAEQERRKVAKDVAAAGIAADGEAWLEPAREQIHDALRESEGSRSPRSGRRWRWSRARCRSHPGPGGEARSPSPRGSWPGAAPPGSWCVAANEGHWRISRPVWTRMEAWLGEVPPPLDEAAGYQELVRRWLGTFGPGTEADLVWWLGSTKGAVRGALADVAAVQVSLDGGGVGWVLPGDEEPGPTVEPWAALLPVLDPTTMGWRDRDFYLDPGHTPYLFDTNGNGGTTAWWNGRIVGCWVQDGDGLVHVVLREDLGADAWAALATEADRLTAWLDGVKIGSVYASLQMKSAVLP